MMLLALALASVGQMPKLMEAKLNNPDSFYKLVLVKEYSPATGFQYIARDNAPSGAYQHWSAAHSWALLQLSDAFQKFGLPAEPALLWAGSAVTLMSMLGLAVLVAKLVINQGSVIAAIVAVIVLLTNGPLRAYGQAIQITHHIFMLVPLAAAAIVLLPSEKPRRHWNLLSFFAGGLLALALWISPETMPLVVVFLATRVAFRMQMRTNEALWPIGLGLCSLLLLAWWQDPPPPTFTAWALDHLSLAWLEFALFISALLALADVLMNLPWTLRARIGMLAVTSMIAAAIWLLTVPNAMHGPSGLIPVELKSLWWNSIRELKPVASAAESVAFVMMPVVAGLLMLISALLRRALWMCVLAISLMVYAVLGAMHIRMAAAAGLLSAIGYGIALAQLQACRDSSRMNATMREQQLALFLIFIPIIQVLLVLLLQKDDVVTNKQNATDNGCYVSEVAETLNSLPAGTILAPLNEGPEILWRTHHRTIAGNYHHNVKGLLDYFHIWRSSIPDDPARRLMDERQIDYILACANEAAAPKLENGQRTLADRMTAGENIDWLSRPQKIGSWWLYRRAP